MFHVPLLTTPVALSSGVPPVHLELVQEKSEVAGAGEGVVLHVDGDLALQQRLYGLDVDDGEVVVLQLHLPQAYHVVEGVWTQPGQDVGHEAEDFECGEVPLDDRGNLGQADFRHVQVLGGLQWC